MTVKRRTLWIADDDWQKVQAVASVRHVNVSQLVREIVLHEHLLDERDRVDRARAQARRDEILKKVNRGSV